MPIEQTAGALEHIVLPEQEVEWLGSGCGGASVAEATVSWNEGV